MKPHTFATAQTWPATDIPKPQGSAFNWRANYALASTKFAADPSHRTPLYAKWNQTEKSIPWEKYRDERLTESKKERRVHAMPKSSISIEPRNLSRINAIPKAKRSAK